MKYLLITLIILLAGCSIGPVTIIHEKETMPKIRVDTGIESCKLRVKLSKQGVDCKYRF